MSKVVKEYNVRVTGSNDTGTLRRVLEWARRSTQGQLFEDP